jgi:hypothetical protein
MKKVLVILSILFIAFVTCAFASDSVEKHEDVVTYPEK